MALEAAKIVGEILDQADPLIDLVSEEVVHYLHGHAKGLKDAGSASNTIHKLVQDTAKRRGKGFMKQLAKWKPAHVVRLLVTTAMLSTAPAPDAKQLFNMLKESQSIAAQASKSREEQARPSMEQYVKERDHLLSEVERGLRDLDGELAEVLQKKHLKLNPAAVWRAKRVFTGDLVVKGQCKRIDSVLALGEAAAPTDEVREKLRPEFWSAFHKVSGLKEGESLNLDDIADADEEWIARSGKSLEDLKGSADYIEFERAILAIQETKTFEHLKQVVGDDFGFIHDIEIAFLNNQATPEQQNAALERLNARNMPLEILDELNPRLAV